MIITCRPSNFEGESSLKTSHLNINWISTINNTHCNININSTINIICCINSSDYCVL